MKKLIYILIAAMGLLSFQACEREQILYPDDATYAAFETESSTISKQLGKVVAIPVYMATTSSESISVDFEFVSDNIEYPAEEDKDFRLLNESKTLTFSGAGYDTIYIEPINNGKDLEKVVAIELLSTSKIDVGINGSMYAYQLTINNDRPLTLADLEGTYDVIAKPTFTGWPTLKYEVVVEIDPNDETQLIIHNFIEDVDSSRAATLPVYATVNLGDNQIYIANEQDLGSWDYADVFIMKLDYTQAGWMVSQDPLVGNIYNYGEEIIIDGYWGPGFAVDDGWSIIYYFFYTVEWSKK